MMTILEENAFPNYEHSFDGKNPITNQGFHTARVVSSMEKQPTKIFNFQMNRGSPSPRTNHNALINGSTNDRSARNTMLQKRISVCNNLFNNLNLSI